ncbi:RNA-dependent RNA polymerase 6 [Prunus yedoensis var. nudiflora]|uniref:RNA-dependent RNA polymerase n=1 Tax=Prunus yedoensis var. nudiflora TaxID=2094558 RepID=A0A314U6J8_PRUYE|nr:RNA-dependent RNA polymerase 6 [Prunus yedoensis var. nudiflora]
MTNENLGPICNAHVVHADRSDDGALDENCLKLAELAALAVDFPKTGKIVSLPHHLKPRLYPDFLGKEDNQSYKSTKILGRLYRKVRDAYDEDAATSSELHYVPSDIHMIWILRFLERLILYLMHGRKSARMMVS